jgi:hypothetical protein
MVNTPAAPRNDSELETRFVTHSECKEMIKETCKLPEGERWVLAKEEYDNQTAGMVYLCRKKLR